MARKFTKLFLGDVVKTVGSRLFRKLTTEEPVVYDELQGTWVFNDTLTLSTAVNYSVNFTSNGVSYTLLTVWHADTVTPRPKGLYFTNSDVELEVYYNVWHYQIYKTITITSKLSEVTNGDDLLTWLKENATKQDTSQLTDLTGTTWNVPSGFIAPSGYGVFDVNYVLYTTDGEFDSTQLAIGYGFSFDSGLSPIENRVSILPAYGAISNLSGFTATFTGGTDATNTSLISWLETNGELTSHTIPTQ